MEGFLKKNKIVKELSLPFFLKKKKKSVYIVATYKVNSQIVKRQL